MQRPTFFARECCRSIVATDWLSRRRADAETNNAREPIGLRILSAVDEQERYADRGPENNPDNWAKEETNAKKGEWRGCALNVADYGSNNWVDHPKGQSGKRRNKDCSKHRGQKICPHLAVASALDAVGDDREHDERTSEESADEKHRGR